MTIENEKIINSDNMNEQKFDELDLENRVRVISPGRMVAKR